MCINYDNLFTIKEISGLVNDKYCMEPRSCQYFVGLVRRLPSNNLRFAMDANTWSKIDNIYMVGKILLHMVSKFIPDLDESLYLFGPTILWDMMRMLCISTWKVIMILIM